jgi:hypothetical protein
MVSTTSRRRRRCFRKVGVPTSEAEEEIALTPAVRAKRFSEVPVTRRKWVGANVERRERLLAKKQGEVRFDGGLYREICVGTEKDTRCEFVVLFNLSVRV